MRYDWEDPPDIADTYYRLSRAPERWPVDDDGGVDGHRSRPEPVTQAELDDYFTRGGRITYQHPRQAQRDRSDARQAARIDARAGLTKLRHKWAEEFDPRHAIPGAVAVAKQHLDEIINATSRRNLRRSERIKGIVKAAPEGWTQADIAAEWRIDPGYLSRLLSDAYRKYPNLEPALKTLSLLNLQAKRHQQSSWQVFSLQWGGEKSDGSGCDADARQESLYANNPEAVKLAELHYEVFPPIQSNFLHALDIDQDEAIESGTQRVLRTAKRDKSYDEADRTDYRAPLWHENYDQLHDAIDAWKRLRRWTGSGECGDLDLKGALRVARLFFEAETIRRDTIDRLPRRLPEESRGEFKIEWPKAATPQSLAWLPSLFIDAPSSNPGYLGPIGRGVPGRRVTAPSSTDYSRWVKLVQRPRDDGTRPKPVYDWAQEAAPIRCRIHNEFAIHLDQRDPGFDDVRAAWRQWASQTKVLAPPKEPNAQRTWFPRVWAPRFVDTVPVLTILEFVGACLLCHQYPIAGNRCIGPIADLGGSRVAGELTIIKYKHFPLSGPLGRGKRSQRFAAAVLNKGLSNVNKTLRKMFPEPASVRMDWGAIEKRLNANRWSPGPMCNPTRWIPLPPVREPHGPFARFTRGDWTFIAVSQVQRMLPLIYVPSVTMGSLSNLPAPGGTDE
jgi:hypothetical protein